MKKLVIGSIRLYQRYISRFTPPTCRFYPTCSHYGIEAVQVHGVVRGSVLTIRRLAKCHPFHPGGIDPVPGKKKGEEVQEDN
ncbi:membrane protein insertion efficiency factor YidD [Alkalicoccus urumqiensis]|uniref:Putative membrane protein insertion efficiency factor n=1 Tax=Alkalicoccus urumqiensis TaxID=1548213 RepID=A0A2P6MDK2_ALKUR|nr:membrane protein insertion efficiency factor YidD [Alkalicoccus urumqiensis]PRO64344.1 membrane protein insertion efficiency factor YidD [Alkalicoccus urumqiensis]